VTFEGHKLIFSCLENLVSDIRLKGFPDLSLADSAPYPIGGYPLRTETVTLSPFFGQLRGILKVD